MYDLEMMEQMGFCNGIENYSRHLSGRKAGRAAADAHRLLPARTSCSIMDESHQTIPQVGAMYRGDRARKETLVEYGFRLPSALDNRPLKFEEFEEHVHAGASTSRRRRATTSSSKAQGVVVEQVIRPTGLMDPVVEVRPVSGQVDDLLGEIRDALQEERARARAPR